MHTQQKQRTRKQRQKTHEASGKTGLKALHVTKDEEKLRAFIMN